MNEGIDEQMNKWLSDIGRLKKGRTGLMSQKFQINNKINQETKTLELDLRTKQESYSDSEAQEYLGQQQSLGLSMCEECNICLNTVRNCMEI